MKKSKFKAAHRLINRANRYGQAPKSSHMLAPLSEYVEAEKLSLKQHAKSNNHGTIRVTAEQRRINAEKRRLQLAA